MTSPPSTLVMRLALAAFVTFPFVLSALGHLTNPYRFLDALYAYRIVPDDWATAVAAVLPFWTLYVGLAACLAPLSPAPLIYAASTSGAFLAAQLSALQRGLKISCGCFGASDEPIGPKSLTVACMAMTASLLALKRLRALDRPSGDLAQGAVSP